MIKKECHAEADSESMNKVYDHLMVETVEILDWFNQYQWYSWCILIHLKRNAVIQINLKDVIPI